MKTQHGDALVHTSTNKQETGSVDVDQLANEIFARLNDESRKESIEDVQQRLARAASLLVRPAAISETAVQVALQGLPPNQLEVLFPHLAGLTCAQIAARLEKPEDAVFKELTSAYVRLRFSVGPNNFSRG